MGISAVPTTIVENGGTSTVTVTLDQAPTSASGFTVPLTFAGTAVRGTDFDVPESITVAQGQTTGSVTLISKDDAIDEDDETVVISIEGQQSITLTITDDDEPATMRISVVPSTIAENGGTSTVTVTLDQAPTSASGFTVPLTFAGTAVRGVDFDAPESITVAQGQTTGSVTLTSSDDAIDEDDETIVVSTEGQQSVTLTITDDDEPAAMSILAVPATIAENGGQSSVTIRLAARESSGTVTLPVTFGGSARLGTDYDVRGDSFAIASGNEIQLPFAQGVIEQTFTVTGLADREKEQDETIIVAVGDQTTTISLTNVFKESVLADVRRIGSFALLRRNSDRFARLTGDVVGARLNGGRFSRVTENESVRATAHELAGGHNTGSANDKQDWNVWISAAGAKLRGDADGTASDVYVGADYTVVPGLVIGVLGSYELGDLKTKGFGDLPGEGGYAGRFDSKGWSVGAYLGARLLDDLVFDVAGSYGQFSPEVSAMFQQGRKITGTYDAGRYLVSGHFTGRAAYGNLVVSPQVGFLYAREEQDSFTDSSNAVARRDTLELGRAEIGTTFTYDFGFMPEFGALGATVTATGRADIVSPDETSKKASAAVRLGLEWQSTFGFAMKLDGGLDGIGLGGYEAYDGSVSFKVDF